MTSSPPSSPPPPTSPISGFRKEALKLLTTAVNAVPTTTATARSTTLPRSRNFLKPDRPLNPGKSLPSRRPLRPLNTRTSSHTAGPPASRPASRRRQGDAEGVGRRGGGQSSARAGVHRQEEKARARSRLN